MINPPLAEPFARDGIKAWSDPDLERPLSHSADAFEMTSPVIREIAGEPSGTLTGKAVVRAYWAKAVTLMPDLPFDGLTTLLGVNSLVRYYWGPRGLAAEVFHGGPDRQVISAEAHYAP